MAWPTNPTDGLEITINGIVFRYDATAAVWNRSRTTISPDSATISQSIGNIVVLNTSQLGSITSGYGNLSNLVVGNATSYTTLGNGTITALGNITGSNLMGPHANGNSNVNIPTINGNVVITAVSNSTLTITGTGVNVTGTLNTGTGNANVGNLGVTTDLIVGGNFVVNGTTTTVNSTTTRIVDPMIEMGGGVNNAALIADDNKDRGLLLHYYTTGVIDAFMGWDDSNGEFAFGSNVSVTSEVITFNTLGNIRAGNAVFSNVTVGNLIGPHANGNSNINIPAANGNINISAVGTANVLVVTGTGVNVAGTLNTGTGNANVGNLGFGTGVITGTGNVTAGNFIGSHANGNSNINIPTANGNVVLTAVGNATVTITGTGVNVIGTLNTGTGNIIAGNIIGNISIGSNAIITTGNITGGNVIGTIAAGSNTITTTGNITGGNIIGPHANGNSNVNIPTINGNVIITAVSNSTLTITGTGVNVAGTLNTGTGNANVGNLGVTSNANVGNLGFGTGVITGTGNITAGNFIGSHANGNSNVNIPTINGNVNISAVGVANVLVVTGTGVNIAGTFSTGTGNANIGNLGITTDLIVSGNLTVSGTTTTVNSTTTRIVDPIIELGGGVNNAALVADDNKDRGLLLHYFSGAATVDAFMGWDDSAGEFGFANSVTVASEVITWTSYGNVRVGNIIGSHANGNSNINIPAANGNVNTSAVGVANVLVVTGTGVNVAGTFNTGAGNANLGNVGTAQVLASANITAPQLISNVAVSTAPLIVTSTTRVANLNVAYANVSDFNVITTQTTGVYYPTFVSGSTTANYALASNTVFSGNIANGAFIATTFAGNLIGTSANLTGLTTAGNFATAGNITASFLVSNVATGTAPFTVTSTTKVANLNADTVDGYDTATAATANTIVVRESGGNITASNITGTLLTASQTNINTIGTLTGLTVSGNTTLTGLVTFKPTVDTMVSLSGATGDVNHDLSIGTIFYHTSIAGSFNINVRYNVAGSGTVPTTTERAFGIVVILVQGATPYIPGLKVDNTPITISWYGGATPTGSANKTDMVSISLVRTSGGAWVAYASASQFG